MENRRNLPGPLIPVLRLLVAPAVPGRYPGRVWGRGMRSILVCVWFCPAESQPAHGAQSRPLALISGMYMVLGCWSLLGAWTESSLSTQQVIKSHAGWELMPLKEPLALA